MCITSCFGLALRSSHLRLAGELKTLKAQLDAQQVCNVLADHNYVLATVTTLLAPPPSLAVRVRVRVSDFVVCYSLQNTAGRV